MTTATAANEQTKIAIAYEVLMMDETKKSVTDIAKEFGYSTRSVRRWAEKFEEQAMDLISEKSEEQEKVEEAFADKKEESKVEERKAPKGYKVGEEEEGGIFYFEKLYVSEKDQNGESGFKTRDEAVDAAWEAFNEDAEALKAKQEKAQAKQEPKEEKKETKQEKKKPSMADEAKKASHVAKNVMRDKRKGDSKKEEKASNTRQDVKPANPEDSEDRRGRRGRTPEGVKSIKQLVLEVLEKHDKAKTLTKENRGEIIEEIMEATNHDRKQASKYFSGYKKKFGGYIEDRT